MNVSTATLPRLTFVTLPNLTCVMSEEYEAKRAKERQLAAQNNDAGRAVKEKIPELEKGQARDKAAKAVGLNRGAKGSVVSGSAREPVKDDRPTLADAGTQPAELHVQRTAALVYAWTEPQSGKRTDLGENSARLTLDQFAELGIRGLSDWRTAALVFAWTYDEGRGRPSKSARNGALLTLKEFAWTYEGTGGPRTGPKGGQLSIREFAELKIRGLSKRDTETSVSPKVDEAKESTEAAELADAFKDEARKRMTAGKGADGSGGRGSQKNPTPKVEEGFESGEAAALAADYRAKFPHGGDRTEQDDRSVVLGSAETYCRAFGFDVQAGFVEWWEGNVSVRHGLNRHTVEVAERGPLPADDAERLTGITKQHDKTSRRREVSTFLETHPDMNRVHIHVNSVHIRPGEKP